MCERTVGSVETTTVGSLAAASGARAGRGATPVGRAAGWRVVRGGAGTGGGPGGVEGGAANFALIVTVGSGAGDAAGGVTGLFIRIVGASRLSSSTASAGAFMRTVGGRSGSGGGV